MPITNMRSIWSTWIIRYKKTEKTWSKNIKRTYIFKFYFVNLLEINQLENKIWIIKFPNFKLISEVHQINKKISKVYKWILPKKPVVNED